MVEAIPDEDQVSRLVDSPHKWTAAEKRFVEVALFEFPSAQPCESVIWRKYAPDIGAVHEHGCTMQASKRAAGRPAWTYEGAVTATVGTIRSIRSQMGDTFSVEHAPEEGQHHAHIGFQLVASEERRKQRKSDLKESLRNVFMASGLAQHQCG